MPLLDHFHGRLSYMWPWQAVHGAWANATVVRLNHGWLPPGHLALPTTKIGGPIEIDVPTIRQENGTSHNGDGAPTAGWALPNPVAVGVIDFAHLDVFEIKIFNEQSGMRLVAAIEFVSPANKDRASHRQAFVSKCASYLNEGVGLVIVDIVTERTGNLHGELMGLFPHIQATHTAADLLYTTAYRVFGAAEQSQLEVWAEPLTVGQPLPTVPLWISDESYVPVDLECTYTDARHNLLIPDDGNP